MLIRALRNDERELFNSAVRHPLQTWEWGEFRKKTGLEIERLGLFDGGKLKQSLQVTFHPIPFINKTAGYIPKGFMPDENQLSSLRKLGKEHNALFVKLEPNVSQLASSAGEGHKKIRKFLKDHGCQPGRSLFTRYTFELDLQKTEEELFSQLSSKTRYNIKVAKKNNVEIFENSTKEGLETYLKILSETTSRQGFYAHTPDYFRKMWEELKDSGMIKIFNAVYQKKVLVSWIVFILGDTIYYPYGASTREHRDVMASNLMMWEIIRFGKSQNCKNFDMWGSLGPEPDPKDPWFGFHRFKKGYGGELKEFIGTYDLVLDPTMYPLFRFAENWRWKFLRFRKKIGI
jgi:lipid II:glycine glycyltransferase (peptidoglycan interpeptide bridge formation enzyme)